MAEIINLKGKIFGRLLVLKMAGKDKHRNILWTCQCECGIIKNISGVGLRTNQTKSCGCYHRDIVSKPNISSITHGKSISKIYNIWHGIKLRCYTKSSTSYKNYGGKGIIVCEEWKNSFEQFYKDMGDIPFEKAQIDRIDNNGPYSKENCRWVTSKQNCFNKSNNKYLTYKGETKLLIDWAIQYNFQRYTITNRLQQGWTIERILETPERRRK